MFDYHVNRSRLVLFALAIVIACSALTLRAAPPAPTLNAPVISGLSVNLSWSNVGATQYFVQAGLASGQTLVEFPVGSATSLPASGPPGTYFVRVVAADATGRGPASNEVVVTLAAGCAVPTPPFNLRAIIRGSEAFIFWRESAGSVSGYTLQVGAAAGQTFAQFPTGATTINATQNSGSFFLRVVANGACGTSAPSNEIQVSFPGNTVRVADPDPGTVLGLPDVGGLVNRIHNENPGLLSQSCPNGIEYVNNPWQDRIVDRLRQYDTRFGYNAKPTRTAAQNNGVPVVAAGDELAFFAGAGNAEGSSLTHTWDILFAHCGGNPQQNVFRNIAPEVSIWTSAGRFPGI